MLILHELVYDPKQRRDVRTVAGRIDFDPKAHATAEAAARAFHAALVPIVSASGQKPDIELSLTSPEETEQLGRGRFWSVSWEAGPFEWAIDLSFEITGPWGYTEPHYSFDLCFIEN